MANDILALSNSLADAVAATAPSVVQVQGRRRPASGVVYAENVVVTMARVLGREDRLHVRRHDGQLFEAELAGWEPASSLAVLKVPGLDLKPLVPTANEARVGHLALAIARSWSNAVTASAGIVSVIGGPLPTGRRRAIDQVLRTTAPMHDGFAGGAFVDPSGALLGITTAAAIRGLGVVIPAAIAWKTAAWVLEYGRAKRAYVGISGQAAQLPESQRPTPQQDRGVLIVSVLDGSPAAAAGVMVGDVLVEFDHHAVRSPDDLLDALVSERIGQTVPVRLLRGGSAVEAAITVGERAGE